MIVITKVKHKADEWISFQDACKTYQCVPRTLQRILDEMKISGRYPAEITAKIGRQRIVDRLALDDYIRNRERLSCGAHVDPYDPGKIAFMLGYKEEGIA